MVKPYEDEEIDELEADDGQEEDDEEQQSEIEEVAADGAAGGGGGAVIDPIDEPTIASRQALREEMERQVAEFLARGGRIQQVEANVTAEPPRKPEAEYGSRSI